MVANPTLITLADIEAKLDWTSQAVLAALARLLPGRFRGSAVTTDTLLRWHRPDELRRPGAFRYRWGAAPRPSPQRPHNDLIGAPRLTSADDLTTAHIGGSRARAPGPATLTRREIRSGS